MIRTATLRDLEALVAGNLEMALETEDLHLDVGTVRAGVRAVLEKRVPGEYFVVEQDGRVLAQLLVTYDWSDWRNRPVWWIQSVHVFDATGREIPGHVHTYEADGARWTELQLDPGSTAAIVRIRKP